jgi:hypothetical protein
LRDQLATTVAVAEGFIVYATDIDGKETIENLQRGFGDALVGTLREDGALASLERGKSSRKKR